MWATALWFCYPIGGNFAFFKKTVDNLLLIRNLCTGLLESAKVGTKEYSCSHEIPFAFGVGCACQLCGVFGGGCLGYLGTGPQRGQTGCPLAPTTLDLAGRGWDAGGCAW